jgi:hypothetical protein
MAPEELARVFYLLMRPMLKIKKMFIWLTALIVLYAQRPMAKDPSADFETINAQESSLMTDQKNPWWVQNSHDVNYSVSIDKNRFKIARKIAERHITDAIDFWRREFFSELLQLRQHTNFIHQNNSTLVATQNFFQKSCNDSVDPTLRRTSCSLIHAFSVRIGLFIQCSLIQFFEYFSASIFLFLNQNHNRQNVYS